MGGEQSNCSPRSSVVRFTISGECSGSSRRPRQCACRDVGLGNFRDHREPAAVGQGQREIIFRYSSRRRPSGGRRDPMNRFDCYVGPREEDDLRKFEG